MVLTLLCLIAATSTVHLTDSTTLQTTITSTVDSTLTSSFTTTTTPTTATTTTVTVVSTPTETLLSGYFELTSSPNNGNPSQFYYTFFDNDGTNLHVKLTTQKSSAVELYLDTTTGYMTGAGHAYTIVGYPNAASAKMVYFASSSQVAGSGFTSISCQLSSGDALTCTINQQPVIFYYCDGYGTFVYAAAGVAATCINDSGQTLGTVVPLAPTFNPS
jgi:hypothetical protein